MARASRAAKRARERVRGMSESPPATRESAGEDVANWCPEAVRSCWVYCHRHIRIGEGVANWCPEAVRSCWVYCHRHIRIGEDVANWCPEAVRSCSSHPHTGVTEQISQKSRDRCSYVGDSRRHCSTAHHTLEREIRRPERDLNPTRSARSARFTPWFKSLQNDSLPANRLTSLVGWRPQNTPGAGFEPASRP